MGAPRSARDPERIAARIDIPIALVLDGSSEIVAMTRDVARSLNVIVRVCEAETAPALAKEWCAFAVIVPWTATDADAEIFDALTRTSGAQVIALSTIVPSA